MKKNINKIFALIAIVLSIVSCNGFPVDEDGLLVTDRSECYVSNFELLDTDFQTIRIGNSYVDTTAQVVIAYVKYGAPLNNLWPQVSLCEDAKLNPKIEERMDFSSSKMQLDFIEGDWISGNASEQLSTRVINAPTLFPSGAKRFTVIAGNRKIKKEYIFLIIERPLQ